MTMASKSFLRLNRYGNMYKSLLYKIIGTVRVKKETLCFSKVGFKIVEQVQRNLNTIFESVISYELF